jgi:hypothetical protein
MNSRDSALLPTFLIVGAMKAGTTTLYRDLLANPSVFFPEDKEPGNLCSEDVCTSAGVAAYARLYRRARPEQARGDATTSYSKLPDYPDVAARASVVLPEPPKIVYLVRHPIERIVSQYRFELAHGRATGDINRVVLEDHRYVAYSSYAVQLTPWVQTFGREHVMVIAFETFIADRTRVIAEVSRFVGIEPRLDGIDRSTAYNVSSGQRIPSGFWDRVSVSPVYRQLLRPLLSVEARRRVRHRILRETPAPAAELTEETQRMLWDRLRDDVRRLDDLIEMPAVSWER